MIWFGCVLWRINYCWFVNVTPSPPPHYLCLLTIPLLSRPVINKWFEGVTHISLPTQEYDRRNGENRRTNEQHEQSLGLTKSRGRYATLHACADYLQRGLLAKIPQCYWNQTHLDSLSLDPIPCCLAFLLSSRQLPLRSPAANCPLCCPAANCPLLGRVVNSHSRPLTTSGYGEISCPRILCLVSRQNRLVCFGGLPT